MAEPTFAPCSNGATRHAARGGNLVGAGKRMPLAEESIEARDPGRTLTADDWGATLTARDQGLTIGEPA